MSIFDLAFSDLFIMEEVAFSYYKENSDSSEIRHVPEHLTNEVVLLRNALDEIKNKTEELASAETADFRIIYEHRPMRVVAMRTLDGVTYVCRNWADSTKNHVKTPEELGLPKLLVEDLSARHIKNGIVIISGQPGSGKSTTAASLFVNRLHTHGGVGWTLERPIERRIEGRHGKGICHQVEVENEASFGKHIERVVRAASNLLMIGEIRNEETARQAIIAAAGGMLVIFTLHASNPAIGLKRLSRMSRENELLANNLVAMLHLSLTSKKEMIANSRLVAPPRIPGNTVYRDYFLNVDPLFVPGTNDEQAIRSAIASADDKGLNGLSSILEHQKKRYAYSEGADFRLEKMAVGKRR